MIKSLRDAQIIDGLPRIVREQPWVKALSMAAAVLHKKTMDYIDGSQIYTAIDSVAEPVLDALAVNWKIDWYDTGYDIDRKRRIVKTALTIRRTMGTVGAVRTHGRFRLRVNIVTVEEREEFEAMSLREIERRLAAAKRFSSHLEEVEYYDAGGVATAYGMAAYVGAEFVESCTTIRVNPSPDTKTGTATAHALAACVGAVIIDFGTTERTGG